jgi:hypothetical protein
MIIKLAEYIGMSARIESVRSCKSAKSFFAIDDSFAGPLQLNGL